MWINLLLLALAYLLTSSHTDAATDYNEVNSDGSFSFGLSNDDVGGHYHTASGSADKIVRGRYGSRNPANGRIEETIYTAGPRGFRARGPQIHRKMDLSQYPRGPVGSPDDPLADPYDDPSYSFNFKTLEYDRQENADSTGRVRGLYSYLDDIGERHTVRYAAGADTGFEVLNSVPDSPASVAYSSPLYKAPTETRGRMSVQRGPDGQYKFILSGPDQRRSETSGPDGIVRGSYSYLDDKGIQRTVQYIAGAGIGYRVVQSTTGAGTHLAPRPALPEFGIRDFQSNDLADDGYLHTAESGRIRPKDDNFKKDEGSSSRTGGTGPNRIGDRDESNLYDRRKPGTSGDRGSLGKPGDRDFAFTGDRSGGPQISGSKTGASDYGSKQGGYDYDRGNEEYDKKTISGDVERPGDRNQVKGPAFVDQTHKPEVDAGHDRGRRPEDHGKKPESDRDDIEKGDRGRKTGSGLGGGFNRKPAFDSVNNDKNRNDVFSGGSSPYLPRDKYTPTRDRDDGAYDERKDSVSGTRNDGSYSKSSEARTRVEGNRGTSDVLPSRRRPPGGSVTSSRKDLYDEYDTEYPLVTTDRRILELDREGDWSLRGRDSTIIKNVGRWYISLPPGQAVRAHVQNIDLLPLHGRIPSPSEALRRDELSKN